MDLYAVRLSTLHAHATRYTRFTQRMAALALSHDSQFEAALSAAVAHVTAAQALIGSIESELKSGEAVKTLHSVHALQKKLEAVVSELPKTVKREAGMCAVSLSLCCVVLCCAVLCCAVLCCAVM